MCTPCNTYRVVMFGLESAGKTTIVSRFSKCKKSSAMRTAPNVQHFDWGPLRVTSIDVGPKLPNKRNIFNGAKAVVFVLDSSDYKCFEEAKTQFWTVAKNPRLKRAIVLVLANKCDCSGALLPRQLESRLEMQCLGRKWKIIRTNARTGYGVNEGLTWIKAGMCPPKKSYIKLLSKFLVQLGSSQQPDPKQ